MCLVYLIELPPMAVSVDDSAVLNRRINIIHVLETPEPTTDHLGQGEVLLHERGVDGAFLNWEEDGDQRKANALLILASKLIDIRNADVLPSIPLIQHTVYRPVELAKGTRLSSEIKRNIKCSVSSGFNQN